jgi:hypothetical protein
MQLEQYIPTYLSESMLKLSLIVHFNNLDWFLWIEFEEHANSLHI